jgi:hypothetical protein
MVADGMLTRQRYREVPPRVDYELTERARELAPVLGELARWGYEWAWGPPRAAERVDLGAIFRLIPGLVGPDSRLSGRVELVVSEADGGEPMSYMVTFAPGSATIAENDHGSADAHVRATTEGWVQALSPLGGRDGLRSTGDKELADALLAVIALSGDRDVSAELSAGGDGAQQGPIAASA